MRELERPSPQSMSIMTIIAGTGATSFSPAMMFSPDMISPPMSLSPPQSAPPGGMTLARPVP
jgi:hypothetical protein